MPHFYGFGSVKEFIKALKADVLEEHRFWALDLAMHATPAWWWETHKGAFQD